MQALSFYRTKFVLFVVLVFVMTSLSAQAQNKVSVHTSLTPAGSFTAVSDKLKGSIVKNGDSISADQLYLVIETLKTDNNLRDEHLHKHLNAAQFPKVILTNLKGQAGKASGMIEVNGIKKPVEIGYTEKNNRIEASMTLKGSDFNLPKARYLGVGVRDEVKIDVQADMMAPGKAPTEQLGLPKKKS